MENRNLWVALIAVAIIALIGWSLPKGGTTIREVVKGGFGDITGTTNFDNLGLQQLKIGATCNTAYSSCVGTAITRINAGFCNIHTAGDTSISASSTETWDCQAGTGTFSALTGVSNGDVCSVQFASTSPTTFGGLEILGQSASTTQGAIVLKIYNATGAAYTWAQAATSSLNYTCFDL